MKQRDSKKLWRWFFIQPLCQQVCREMCWVQTKLQKYKERKQ